MSVCVYIYMDYCSAVTPAVVELKCRDKDLTKD